MLKLIILGTANAIPDAAREYTHLVLVGDERTVLVDCGSNPLIRLTQAGVDIHKITDLVLTHFHPDHVSGAPLLLMNMWLLGRCHTLNVYGLAYTLDRMEALMEAYGWQEWPDFFPVHFSRIANEEMTEMIDCSEFRILTSPVQHMIPAIGLRFEIKRPQKVIAYSCDTEPCQQVINLADMSDVLIHEASGEIHGHSTAVQAGKIAYDSRAKELYLIHFPVEIDRKVLIADAHLQYKGSVKIASDFMEFNFS